MPFLALGDEFYLRSDSLIQSYWRWHETLPSGQGKKWSASTRRESAKRAQGKYTKCFIYPGLGCVARSGVLATLITLDPTRLNSRKITSRIHAKRGNETRASTASCCPADIVTHVDALNKLKRFRNSGEP